MTQLLIRYGCLLLFRRGKARSAVGEALTVVASAPLPRTPLDRLPAGVRPWPEAAQAMTIQIVGGLKLRIK